MHYVFGNVAALVTFIRIRLDARGSKPEVNTGSMESPLDELLAELERTDWVSEDEIGAFSLGLNMRADNKYFPPYEPFFSSIGYIAFQIAAIEDNIRQSLYEITDDIEAVDAETNRKNLGALLSLYELVYLAKFSGDEESINWFYGVKKILLKANQVRNEAVHSTWMFLDSNPDLPCYPKVRGGKPGYLIIKPDQMRKRAVFAHEAYLCFDNLRAAMGSPADWDEAVIQKARSELARLTQL